MLKKFMKAALVAAMVCAIGCGAQAADYIVSGGHGGGGGGGAATGGLGAKGGDASEAAFGQEAAAGGNGNSGLLASGSDGIGGLGGKNAGPANAAETTGTGLASGVGGDGGSAVAGTGIVDVADLADYDALSVTGGFGGAPGAAGDSGGNGGKGGKGGAGGAVTVTFTNAAGVEDIEAAIAAARALRVTGGTANNTANGGAGGTATVKLGSAVVAVTDVVLQGGVSGNSDSNAGGKAILSGGTQAVRGQDNKLLVSGNITLTTGVTAGEDVHFGNTGVVDATSKFMDTDLGVIFSGDSTVALTLGNALNVASSFTTSSLEIMAGTESDLNEVTITGIVNTDAKSFSVDATTARTFALGDIALGGYTKLTATGADVSAVVGNLKITGADNTIVNNAASTALVMNAGKTVTFDLAGVTAGQTMLNLGTGGLTGNAAGTNILVDNVSALKYGESVMLVNKATNGTAPFTVGSRKVALATAVDMAADEAGNIYGYKVNFMTAAGAAGVSGTDGLGLRMYKSILVGDDTMTSAVAMVTSTPSAAR